MFFLILVLNVFQLQIKNSFYFVSAPISKVLLRSGNNTADLFKPLFNVGDMKKENGNFLNIKNWAAEDRPREKLLLKGKAALSDSELIAILLGTVLGQVLRSWF